MKTSFRPRLRWLLWLAVLVLFASNALTPISTSWTRVAGLGLLGTAWLGLIILLWPRRCVRWTLLGLTLLVLGFLVYPAHSPVDAEALRHRYVAGLRRYQGTPYVWGGESLKGIDCSGLVRRGLIDAAFLQGTRTLNPATLHYSLSLWWHDCSAQALGQEYRGATRHLFDVSSLNTLDPGRLRAGDFAVTRDGVHTMAYLGGGEWIEADPGEMRVITLHVPAGNPYFSTPMRIMRWRVFDP